MIIGVMWYYWVLAVGVCVGILCGSTWWYSRG